MNMKILMFIFTLGLLVSGYNIGCIYPETMDIDPFKERMRVIGIFVDDIMRANSWETPIVIRAGHMSAACQAKCLSLHYPNVLNPMNNEPAEFVVPPFGRNVWSVVMCNQQCVHTLFDGWSDISNTYARILKDDIDVSLERPTERLRDAVDMYLDDPRNFGELKEIVLAEDYHPHLIGQVAGLFLKPEFDNDGWNQDGSKMYDPASGSTVECTSSCRAFQDTSGYRPVEDPRYKDDWRWRSEEDGIGGSVCDGDCRRWQPLQEEDGYGSLRRQEFVVPHIGSAGKTYLREPTMMTDTPTYNYRQASLDVITELAEAAEDPKKMAQIAFFDDKLDVRHLFQRETRLQFAPEHSFQDHILYIFGLSAGEYDGVIQGWKEKVRHDLVRPTTVIKSWGDEIIRTYSADAGDGQAVDINARDFEAFLRVMPHGEHPSGSSCLCKTYQEFTDAFTMDRYGGVVTGATETHRGETLIWETTADILDACGQSRLWGGLHYPQAIPDGEQICAGLGQLAYNWIQMTKNNEEWFHFDRDAGKQFGPYYDHRDADPTYNTLPVCGTTGSV